MYGSAAGLKKKIGTLRLAGAVEDSSDAYYDSVLTASSAVLDSYFQIFYEVPIDTTSLDTVKKENLDSYLQELAYGIAVQFLFSGAKETPKGANIYLERTLSTLRKIQRGEVILPYLDRLYSKTFLTGGETENRISSDPFVCSRLDVG